MASQSAYAAKVPLSAARARSGPVARLCRRLQITRHRLDWNADAPPRRERLAALALGALATLAVLFTPGDYGLSWDEAYYYQPSIDAAGWIASALTLEPGWAGAEGVNRGFGRVWELPAVVKLANGLAWALAAPWVGELRAMRLPSAFAFGAAVALVYLLGWMAWGRVGALAAALAFATMPRVFGHAHLAASETMTTATFLFAIYAFLRGLRSPGWAAGAAAALALALATKINAVFLPAILLPWAWLHARRQSLRNLYAWIFLAPPLFFLFWPWLWSGAGAKLLRYADFALQHPFLGLFFLGRKWNFVHDAAPWYYPAVITAVTTPPLTLLLALAGAVWSLIFWRRINSVARLILWAALFLLGVASLPSTPKYDGVRLFLPAMPFLALLAGGAVATLAQIFGAFALTRMRGDKYEYLSLAVIVASFLLAGALAIAPVHSRELSYYNLFVGGLEGAERHGFEIVYWGECLNSEVLADLNRTLPPGARLKTLALHDRALWILQNQGALRRDLQINGPPPHEFFLLQYRRGFWARFEEELYARHAPLRVWDHRGVPMLMLYRIPPPPPAAAAAAAPSRPARSAPPEP